jgi:hypothetical protein
MKRILQMAALAIFILLGSSYPNEASAQYDGYDGGYYDEGYSDNRGDVSYQTFYDELSPHGNWVEYPGYGYVWQPSLGNDFRPYSTGGHWVWSDRYEWVWVSDYDWGWAPFHYGRWFQDDRYGWLWVPGYEWSGAWVSWRDGGDYYGWAPIRPGINININYNMGGYYAPNDWWTFTPRRTILYRDWHNHCVDYRRNVTIIHQTTIINNYYYGDSYGFRTGPRREYFERYTGRVTPVQFRQSNRPGRSSFRDNEVSIYRPSVRQDNDRVQPRRFERYDGNRAINNDTRSSDVRSGGNEGFRTRNRETIQPRHTNDLPRERNSNDRFERNDSRPRDVENEPVRNNPPTRRFERTENEPVRNQEIQPRRQEPVRSNETGTTEPRFERRREPSVNQAPVRQREVDNRPQQQPRMERPQPAPQMERRQHPASQMERRQQQSSPQVSPRENVQRPNNNGSGEINTRSPRRF